MERYVPVVATSENHRTEASIAILPSAANLFKEWQQALSCRDHAGLWGLLTKSMALVPSPET